MRCANAAVLALVLVGQISCTDTREDEPTDSGAEAAELPPVPEDVGSPPIDTGPPPPPPSGLCADVAPAPPVVEELADGLFVARGFDLANTILIRTDVGNVVIDVSMSPPRAEAVRQALQDVSPGPTVAVIYTHSHIDHIGGASAWVEEGTEIWATDAFFEHLIKQYGAFRGAEQRRGALQHGEGLDDAALPCSSIGRRVDLTAALETGVRKPTHTFSGAHTLEIGGVTIELVEAPGETHDQLFVWVPALDALMPGDNYYSAFPNLYTIRGTSPRPVRDWVESLDQMRRRDPALLVPSHTAPVIGREVVREVLRDYRDAIQWVADEVVRGANALESVDRMAARVALPEHLAARPYLAELYGHVHWSVRAIYGYELGWFDGRAERLYPPEDFAAREVALMGGADAVLAEAQQARESGDLRWSSHLLGKLRDAGALDAAALGLELAATWSALAATVENTNGRAYLLGAAREATDGALPLGQGSLDDEFIDELPIEVVFEVMQTRLIQQQANVHEAMAWSFTDTADTFVVTVRFGVAEVVAGTPLPGAPAPIDTVVTDTGTWRRLALGQMDPLDAVAQGKLQADDLLAVLTFMGRFEQ